MTVGVEMIYKEFHEAGFRFFGIKGVTDGVCDCENPHCAALFKHPWYKNWQHTPQWSDEQIELMEESGQLEHGYGVIVADGLLVVDIDARNGGVQSYTRLIENFPSLMGAGLIVETGSGGGSKHLYFRVNPGIALMQHHKDYPGIDFKSTGFVIGPGSKHISGNTYKVLIGDPQEISLVPQDFIDFLTRPEIHRALFDGKHVDVEDKDIADMLSFISPDCDHETWIKCGMAIHHATEGNSFELWDTWSKSSPKYPGSDALGRRWHSFGKTANPVSIGTLLHYAKSAGWKPPVTFQSDEVFDVVESDDSIDTGSVDLLRPPGFVGEVAKWLNTQGHKLREHLSVAAALTTVGNIAGLRYQETYGMRLNLFTFCVAASGTGKEAMLQGATEMHVAAGLTKAVHGNFKSEQELISNIIYNQAAYYMVDEIGTVMAKVANASKKGGASYLEGLVGQLMSIYSKSNGRFTLTGDRGREVIESLLKDAARFQKAVDENVNVEQSQRKLESILRQLNQIETQGIVNPFLSMMGMTTPETFNSLVTPDFVKNGFMSRALFFEERDTNPKPKPFSEKPPLPKSIKNTLISLATGGHYDASTRRIEATDEPTRIQTTPEALELLKKASDKFHEMGEQYKEQNGFEAITTRGYELVSKVSSILAVAEGVRTVEHVNWAYELVRQDLNRKAMLAFTNDETVRDTGKQLMGRILNRLTKDHGETVAVLCNRIRGSRKEDIEKALEEMEKAGMVIKKDEQRGSKVTSRYYGIE